MGAMSRRVRSSTSDSVYPSCTIELDREGDLRDPWVFPLKPASGTHALELPCAGAAGDNRLG